MHTEVNAAVALHPKVAGPLDLGPLTEVAHTYLRTLKRKLTTYKGGKTQENRELSLQHQMQIRVRSVCEIRCRGSRLNVVFLRLTTRAVFVSCFFSYVRSVSRVLKFGKLSPMRLSMQPCMRTTRRPTTANR